MRTFELVDRLTGEVTFDGTPVTRSKPCDICGHPTNKHEGWCLRDSVRGLTICGHVPSPRKVGDAGWLHGQADNEKNLVRAAASQQRPRPPFNAALLQPMLRAITPKQLSTAAENLGVSTASLMELEIGWSVDKSAFAFPMRDANHRIIGIRLRKPDGFKFAIENSRNGLFYPALKRDGPVMLTEGPTDTAAMLTLGLDSIGRPFCRGGIESLCEVFGNIQRPAVVIADQDEAGLAGATATADALFGIAQWVKVIKPPPGIKDARAWLQAGATKDSVLYRVEQEDFWQPEEVAA